MKELLKKESGIPIMHAYRYQAHIANLVAKDFISSREIKGILLKVKEVLKWFSNTHTGSAGLREHNVPRPPRACKTRWNSYADVFEYFVKHWSILGEIINSKLKLIDVEYRYMEQMQLKHSATEAMKFLNPLAIALDQFQSNACTLSQTIDIWATVVNSAPDHFMQQQPATKNGIFRCSASRISH